MEHLYYKASGRFTLLGLALYFIIGIFAVAFLSFLYVFLVWFIPFIYINFLLTLCFGVILGLILNFSIKTGKIRNPAMAALLGIIIGLFAVYVQWTVYKTLQYNMGEVLQYGSKRRGFSFAKTSFDLDTFWTFLNDPEQVFTLMKDLSANGSWTVFGITVKGFFLWAVWIIEGLIIAGCPMMFSLMKAEEPYSEVLDKWLKERAIDKRYPFVEKPEDLKNDLEKGNYSYLEQPLQADFDTKKYAKVAVFADEDDPEHIYISLNNITQSHDKDGREKEDTESIVQYLNIPFRIYSLLQANDSVSPTFEEIKRGI